MPFYTGKSADGSDIKELKGVYESPCGNYWSSQPITRDQKAYDKAYDHCARYRKSFQALYDQLKSGSSENLPKWVRTWFINKYETEQE